MFWTVLWPAKFLDEISPFLLFSLEGNIIECFCLAALPTIPLPPTLWWLKNRIEVISFWIESSQFGAMNEMCVQNILWSLGGICECMSMRRWDKVCVCCVCVGVHTCTPYGISKLKLTSPWVNPQSMPMSAINVMDRLLGGPIHPVCWCLHFVLSPSLDCSSTCFLLLTNRPWQRLWGFTFMTTYVIQNSSC